MAQQDLIKQLSGLPKRELERHAKRLGIAKFSSLTKVKLIEQLVANPKIHRELNPTWWQTHHNHVYGIATLLGLAIAVCEVWPAAGSDSDESQTAHIQTASSVDDTSPVAKDEAETDQQGTDRDSTLLESRESNGLQEETWGIHDLPGHFQPYKDNVTEVRRYVIETHPGEMIEQVAEQDESKREETSINIYKDRWIQDSGWKGVILDTPSRKSVIWTCNISDNRTEALVLINTKQDLSDFRKGMKMRYRGQIHSVSAKLVHVIDAELILMPPDISGYSL